MKIKLLAFVALTAPFTFNAGAQTPPPQAVAAGYTSLVFDDEFTTTTTIAPTMNATSGYKWYWYDATQAGDYSVNTTEASGGATPGVGVLTINTDHSGFGEDLETVPTNATGATRTGTFQHAYFESYIQYSTTPGATATGAWPAFWSWAVQQWSATTGEHTAELDFMEAYPNNPKAGINYITTIHDWTFPDTSVYLSPNDPTQQPTDSGWHTYGCLWTPNKVQFYLDNKVCTYPGGVTTLTVGPGTSFASLEQDNMFVILGTGTNWPMKVDWVRVWQASTATGTVAQSITAFPTTQSLSTTNSPYVLTASLSSGLPITYAVTSGPATVSGSTLTITGAGTVVLQASQAGNATYAPFSATETITVTDPVLTTQTVSGFPSTLSLSTTQSPYTLPAATSAGLTISYSVTSGPATVSGHKLTITGAGTVVVKASQAGNSTYAAFSATETITVTAPALTTQTVSNFPSTLSLTTAQSPYTLSATLSSGLKVTYSVVSGPATVSGDTLTLTGTGTVVLQASQAGNSTYAPFTTTETITVTAPASSTSGTTGGTTSGGYSHWGKW